MVFGGFSSDALAARIASCGAKVVLTATGGMRAKKQIQLKQIVDTALEGAAKQGAEVRASIRMPLAIHDVKLETALATIIEEKFVRGYGREFSLPSRLIDILYLPVKLAFQLCNRMTCAPIHPAASQ